MRSCVSGNFTPAGWPAGVGRNAVWKAAACLASDWHACLRFSWLSLASTFDVYKFASIHFDLLASTGYVVAHTITYDMFHLVDCRRPAVCGGAIATAEVLGCLGVSNAPVLLPGAAICDFFFCSRCRKAVFTS